MDKSDGFLNRRLWVRVPSGVPHGSRLVAGLQALNLRALVRFRPPVPMCIRGVHQYDFAGVLPAPYNISI